MSGGWEKYVVYGGRATYNFFKNRWLALVSPRTAIRLKELDVIGKAQGIRHKERENVLKSASKLRKLYKELGVPDQQIRDRVESMIAMGSDPLSVIADFVTDGKARLVDPPPIELLPEKPEKDERVKVGPDGPSKEGKGKGKRRRGKR